MIQAQKFPWPVTTSEREDEGTDFSTQRRDGEMQNLKHFGWLLP